MRNMIRLIRKGRVVELSDVGPTETLLDYLRLRERATGTKEGCNEGDCGACTVVLGTRENGSLVYRPVNACIQLLGMMDGREVVTVEDLAEDDGRLHPVQQALVERHGSQCGFCTPGIVMSLFALYHAEERPDRAAVLDQLAGNLCRCTGYRPIVEAGLAACAEAPDDRFTRVELDKATLLQSLTDRQDVFIGNDEAYFAAPRTLAGLAAMYERHPDATLVAGATDVGLWITKQLRPLKKIIYLGRVSGLDRVEDLGAALLVGAAATFEACEPFMRAIGPDLGEVWRRLGSRQVRAAGTVGGNVANGSPIGDSPPALIALGATLELRRGSEARTMPIEEFFLDYGQQDRRPGEFVTGILVPKLRPGDVFRCYKISKRFDQDISSVFGAFRFSVIGGVIREARVAFGGMAGTPKRARAVEAALVGVEPARAQGWASAIEAMAADYTPLSDMRASADYRLETARALLAKALVEAAGAPTDRTRVTGRREAATHVA